MVAIIGFAIFSMIGRSSWPLAIIRSAVVIANLKFSSSHTCVSSR